MVGHFNRQLWEKIGKEIFSFLGFGRFSHGPIPIFFIVVSDFMVHFFFSRQVRTSRLDVSDFSWVFFKKKKKKILHDITCNCGSFSWNVRTFLWISGKIPSIFRECLWTCAKFGENFQKIDESFQKSHENVRKFMKNSRNGFHDYRRLMSHKLCVTYNSIPNCYS